MAVDIEESCCCAGKAVVDVAGGQLDWEDTGFVLEGIHTLPFVADPEGQL